MRARQFALVAVFVMLGLSAGAARQAASGQAVLVRGADGVLAVASVLAHPGDRVAVANSQVMVNGQRMDVRVQGGENWGPQVVEAGMFFVAGDPAGLGNDKWGLIPRDRIVGTVSLGAMPQR